jgi:hypothetical protein
VRIPHQSGESPDWIAARARLSTLPLCTTCASSASVHPADCLHFSHSLLTRASTPLASSTFALRLRLHSLSRVPLAHASTPQLVCHFCANMSPQPFTYPCRPSLTFHAYLHHSYVFSVLLRPLRIVSALHASSPLFALPILRTPCLHSLHTFLQDRHTFYYILF